jgi:hypothetical protein
MPHPAARRQRMMAKQEVRQAASAQAQAIARRRQRIGGPGTPRGGPRYGHNPPRRLPVKGRLPVERIGGPGTPRGGPRYGHNPPPQKPRFGGPGTPRGGPRYGHNPPPQKPSKWVRRAAAYSKAAHANIRENAPSPRVAAARIARSDLRAYRNVTRQAQRQKARRAIRRSRPGQPGVLR